MTTRAAKRAASVAAGQPLDTRFRVVIENVQPEIDNGAYPIKRTTGEDVDVQADIFTDGHDAVSATLRYRRKGETDWREVAFEPLVNDRWQARFAVEEFSDYEYTMFAWVDRFKTWRRDLMKRLQAGQDVSVDLQVGADLVKAAATRATARERPAVLEWAQRLVDKTAPLESRSELAIGAELNTVMTALPDHASVVNYPRVLGVAVDRPLARFSSWYEFFPRSCTDTPDGHGTFRDCEARLPYIKAMGFDIVYLPPVHPIGITRRKGRNNRVMAEPGDVGSPWAIGGKAGGHDSINPDLGTVEDFERFVAKAKAAGIEVALDIALQCSPDHPYVTAHPEWFRKRPDGSIQYAENPPKKYEDIYPFDFEGETREDLYQEIKRVFLVWIERGITVFRVDNPHTKPFALWERLIRELRSMHPELIFLAEAFTRPKVMYRLAKAGFTQSYTYFAWRNVKWELTQYFAELTTTRVREFFRPNLWPNTPDILTEYLQTGGRPAYVARLVLAATLGASYGIYGPAFELMASRPREHGSEEYLDSEKYQVRVWDLKSPDSLQELISIVNRIRRDNPALHSDGSLRFHETDNESIICYSKRDEARDNTVLVVVNLDPHHTHTGWVSVDPAAIGIPPEEQYQVHDLISDARYIWQGSRNFVLLDPNVMPAHVFRIRRRVRNERDFDYFM